MNYRGFVKIKNIKQRRLKNLEYLSIGIIIVSFLLMTMSILKLDSFRMVICSGLIITAEYFILQKIIKQRVRNLKKQIHRINRQIFLMYKLKV